MRISDWSSDVCSSDLAGHGPGRCALHVLYEPVERPECETGQAVDPARREAAEQVAEDAEPAALERRIFPKLDVVHWPGIPTLGDLAKLDARRTEQRHADEELRGIGSASIRPEHLDNLGQIGRAHV